MWRSKNPNQNNFDESQLVLHWIPLLIFLMNHLTQGKYLKENIPHLHTCSDRFKSAQVYISLVIAGRINSLFPQIVLDPSCLICILYQFWLCPNTLNSVFYIQLRVHSLYLLTAHGSFNRKNILTYTQLSRSFQTSMILSIPNISFAGLTLLSVLSVRPEPPA